MKQILERLLLNKQKILNILKEIEEEDVATEELFLSIEALKHKQKYINNKKITLSVYLPMNLPLFSLITYAVIPSNPSNTIYYRPSSKITNISKQIHQLLNLNESGIHLFEGNRTEYFNRIVYNSNIVIFVGKPENMEQLAKKLNNNTMLIYFGVGQNPIIVEQDANLELAATKILDTILFNYGQDCSKPNIILCKEEIFEKLFLKLKHQLELKIAKGNIHELNTLKEISNLLIKESKNIIYGGNINFRNNTISPTIIKKNFKIEPSIYKEYYAPIIRIMTYTTDEQLKQYFREPAYQNENMNITLFGTSQFISNLHSSIVLENEVVPDIDNGYCEFGGYGKYTSTINYKGIKISKTILINREIYNFYENPNFNIHFKSTNKLNEIIFREYKEHVTQIFKENMNFSYIFGSYAKQNAKKVSDIDMLICLFNQNEEQIQQFRKWYFAFHYIYGKKTDIYYPGEILTTEKLESILEKNKTITFKRKNTSDKFDSIFYTQIFSDKKIEILGNKNQLQEYVQRFNKFIPLFCEQIFSYLQINNLFESERDYIKALFTLSKNDLLYFSNKLEFTYQLPQEKHKQIIRELDDGLLIKSLKRNYP